MPDDGTKKELSSFRLSAENLRRIEEYARKHGLSRAQVVDLAVKKLFDHYREHGDPLDFTLDP